MFTKVKQAVLAVMLALALPAIAHAQAGAGGFSGSTSIGNPSLGDPCLSFTHISAPMALASATTSKVISNVAGLNTYICGITADIISSATAQIVYGTGTLCATGLTGVSGIMTGAAVVNANETQASKLIVPAGKDICVVGTGAGADVGGWITYVQAPR